MPRKEPQTNCIDVVYDTWWSPLVAVPPTLHSAGYQRLRTLWFDPTRVHRLKGQEGDLVHEYYVSRHETHLTAMLWENFALFDSPSWVPELFKTAGLPLPASVSAVNWSYGWVYRDAGVRRNMDVVVHFRSADGNDGVVVVEAKVPWSTALAEKDRVPDYYLSVPAFNGIARRSQIYLVDEASIEKTRKRIRPSSYEVGYLSWQSLGDIQVRLVDKLKVSDAISMMIKTSLIRQYAQYGIRLHALNGEYLCREMDRLKISELPTRQRQKKEERRSEIWRLPMKSG